MAARRDITQRVENQTAAHHQSGLLAKQLEHSQLLANSYIDNSNFIKS